MTENRVENFYAFDFFLFFFFLNFLRWKARVIITWGFSLIEFSATNIQKIKTFLIK